MEAIQGRANLLSFPYRTDQRDEQYQHSLRLKKFVNLEVSTDLADLNSLFERALAGLGPGRGADRRAELDCAGAAHIEQLVLADLGVTDLPARSLPEAEANPRGQIDAL
jgi:hypothetical protein